jgi:hypothetical protein
MQLASGARPRPGKTIVTTSATTTSTASGWPLIVAVASWQAITRRAQTRVGVRSDSRVSDLFDRRRQLERKAYAAIAKEDGPRTHSTTPK